MKRADTLRLLSGQAADQWGLITAAQANASAVHAVHLLRLVEAGLLESVGRGVYLVAGAVQPEHLPIKVAWLRLEPELPAWQRQTAGHYGGVISHGSACELHSLGDLPTSTVEISVPRRRTTRDQSVRLHRSELDSTDVTIVDGLPVTTAERTIVDLLKARTDGAHVGGVIADADRQSLINQDALARRVTGFTAAYGLPASASGRRLLDYLAEQADAKLSVEEATRLRREGVARGFTSAIVLLSELSDERRRQPADRSVNAEVFEVVRELAEHYPDQLADLPKRALSSLGEQLARAVGPAAARCAASPAARSATRSSSCAKLKIKRRGRTLLLTPVSTVGNERDSEETE